MSTEKLQQAITLIKAGNKKGGQNLLVDIVNTDPKNETAWLWLASVVSQDKRIFCLEKVLDINPNNVQARQYLEKLKTNGPIQPNSTPQPSIVNKEGTPKVVEQPKTSSPQYWAIPVGKEVRIIVLESQKLLIFDVVPERVPLVLAQIISGSITKDWFSKNIALGVQGLTFKSIPINSIIQVRLLVNRIKVDFRKDDGNDSSVDIRSDKDETIESILSGIQNQLGEGFTRVSKPTSRWNVAGWSLIMFLLTFCGTGVLYWMQLDLVGKEVRGRYSAITSLFQLLGTNGVLCIGGIVTVVLLIVFAGMFAKPPMETLLVRKISLKP